MALISHSIVSRRTQRFNTGQALLRGALLCYRERVVTDADAIRRHETHRQASTQTTDRAPESESSRQATTRVGHIVKSDIKTRTIGRAKRTIK